MQAVAVFVESLGSHQCFPLATSESEMYSKFRDHQESFYANGRCLHTLNRMVVTIPIPSNALPVSEVEQAICPVSNCCIRGFSAAGWRQSIARWWRLLYPEWKDFGDFTLFWEEV